MKIEKQNRRVFLKSSVIGISALGFAKDTAAGEIMFSGSYVELKEITISELQAGMKSGRFSAKMLVEKYLERIKEIDP